MTIIIYKLSFLRKQENWAIEFRMPRKYKLPLKVVTNKVLAAKLAPVKEYKKKLINAIWKTVHEDFLFWCERDHGNMGF